MKVDIFFFLKIQSIASGIPSATEKGQENIAEKATVYTAQLYLFLSQNPSHKHERYMHVDEGRKAVEEIKLPIDKTVSQSQRLETLPPNTTYKFRI